MVSFHGLRVFSLKCNNILFVSENPNPYFSNINFGSSQL
ncbi:hypothetical protein XBJ1_3017 [Xenorhabdus bovienii SS-2004]|uniref:Uncharacterized protein n=1 Tax=Xenorhabdus bovienii (strain SS-2004) TaxID=406818 RepID=D3V8H9_XENBS|nr:hypothetical protein XBJ1_3017 [Xenorhabdus bovienii SS-2004]